jgi:adenylate cyclase
VQRKLAAILSADAAGFSRLMGEDDVATVKLIATCRSTVGEMVAGHGGRVVDSPGDNILAEFGSAIDAVRAALGMQDKLAACNAGLPESRRMIFRVGINLGDVIVEDGRLYGDGVNIAARIEALAEAGGICISGKVYDEVSRKLDAAFEDLGEHTLKNIAAPMRVYRVRPLNHAPAAKTSELARPAKPSIIVLPFTNMSGTADQDLFADGLTEDILTELSRFRDLFVISRNTSFKYRGKTVEVQKVARELGVQYVLEGSVRRAGNRVRVTAQLIDGESDRHLWAERYDRDIEDIFELQDEVTRAVVAVLPGRVEAAARDRAARKPTGNMAAYECVITGKVLHHRSNREDNAEALRLVTRAIELDPKYAHAHAWRACTLAQQWTYGWCADMKATEDELRREAMAALALDENDSDVHRIQAALHLTRDEHDQAAYHQDRALALNPNDDLIVVQQGELLTWLGQAAEGIEWIKKAMRLNPFHPERFWSHLARAQFVARRYDDALQSMQHVTAPNRLHLANIAACHALKGDQAAAGTLVRQVLAQNPDFRIGKDVLPTLHYKKESDLEHHREGLLKAGLPE